MDSQVDELLVEVRAGTQGFAADIQQMRASVDNILGDGFAQVGNVLEKSLLTALRKGSFGFDDLRRTASRALEQIAAQILQLDFGQLSGGAGGMQLGAAGGDFNLMFGGLLGKILGLPGRATGGPVSPGRGYMVGERGPEMFVPTSAGRVETLDARGGPERKVSVTIKLAEPRGASAPAALQRSSRQTASALRRVLSF